VLERTVTPPKDPRARQNVKVGIHVIDLDVTKPAVVESAIREIESAGGQINVLVDNAGRKSFAISA
jgi:short-subunit dehydrogenase